MPSKRDEQRSWRREFRSCRHKYVFAERRCSHRPNGNPLCNVLGVVRCTYAVCPLRKKAE